MIAHFIGNSKLLTNLRNGKVNLLAIQNLLYSCITQFILLQVPIGPC